jgi:hypothetical protein
VPSLPVFRYSLGLFFENALFAFVREFHSQGTAIVEQCHSAFGGDFGTESIIADATVTLPPPITLPVWRF